jgi:hypothetical protein
MSFTQAEGSTKLGLGERKATLIVMSVWLMGRCSFPLTVQRRLVPREGKTTVNSDSEIRRTC